METYLVIFTANVLPVALKNCFSNLSVKYVIKVHSSLKQCFARDTICWWGLLDLAPKFHSNFPKSELFLTDSKKRFIFWKTWRHQNHSEIKWPLWYRTLEGMANKISYLSYILHKPLLENLLNLTVHNELG